MANTILTIKMIIDGVDVFMSGDRIGLRVSDPHRVAAWVVVRVVRKAKASDGTRMSFS